MPCQTVGKQKNKSMPSHKNSIRVGTGAGFSDDRIEPAVDLAERGFQVQEVGVVGGHGAASGNGLSA